MAQQPNERIKQLTIRWPESFWEEVSIAATKRRTTIQLIVNEAVARFLEIDAPAQQQKGAA